MNDLVRIPFHGTEILAVDIDGKPAVILKPFVENLGLDFDSQREKLTKRSWAATGLNRVQVYYQGQRREVLAVDVRTALMLLATIDENRVSPEARPLLVAYQAEVADVIESYWTQGGAINPRATADQLTVLAARAEVQTRVLRNLSGIVDRAWLEAKARHVAARALGEEPEVDPARRPITVGDYLMERGMAGVALRSLSPKFGKRVKAAYIKATGRTPSTVERFVDNALRQVAVYTERDRPLFDQVWNEMTR